MPTPWCLLTDRMYLLVGADGPSSPSLSLHAPIGPDCLLLLQVVAVSFSSDSGSGRHLRASPDGGGRCHSRATRVGVCRLGPSPPSSGLRLPRSSSTSMSPERFQVVSNTLELFSSSYCFDNLGFITEGKLTDVLFTPFSWGILTKLYSKLGRVKTFYDAVARELRTTSISSSSSVTFQGERRFSQVEYLTTNLFTLFLFC